MKIQLAQWMIRRVLKVHRIPSMRGLVVFSLILLIARWMGTPALQVIHRGKSDNHYFNSESFFRRITFSTMERTIEVN